MLESCKLAKVLSEKIESFNFILCAFKRVFRKSAPIVLFWSAVDVPVVFGNVELDEVGVTVKFACSVGLLKKKK